MTGATAAPPASAGAEVVAVAPEPPPEEETPEEPFARAGSTACGVGALPDSFRIDLSDEDAAALVAFAQEWTERANIPRIATRHGIAFAKSVDDTGRDGPYPSFVGAASERACGVHAVWLRDATSSAIERRARSGDFTLECYENVCCYAAAGEFDSSASFAFRRADEQWVLTAVAIVADNGALAEEARAQNRSTVHAALGRAARGTCAREPDVIW